MNRIILIGNGFDIAHGVPTRYEDFINWYWNKWLYNLMACRDNTLSDGLCTFSIKKEKNTWYSLLWQLGFTHNLPKGKDFIEQIIANKESFDVGFSSLFNQIRTSLCEKKWVDIENEYYRLLRESLSDNGKCIYSVKELNDQLELILILLAEYLKSLYICDSICNENIARIILEPIKYEDIAIGSNVHFQEHCHYWANQSRHALYKELEVYGKSNDQGLAIRESVDSFLRSAVTKSRDGRMIVTDMAKIPPQLLKPLNTMLLSFNYTQVADAYAQCCKVSRNHVHGDLTNPSNMIFGYGDELDSAYQDILKQEDNEYLKNIKSIRYLESPNYRELLQFINAAPYQVYIMGHSCGNSDRTLLNTLFEHKNCISIKPFYHQKEDSSDNYIDMVQNICRNFTDMKLMRDRVVNKTFCEPLPQVKK